MSTGGDTQTRTLLFALHGGEFNLAAASAYAATQRRSKGFSPQQEDDMVPLSTGEMQYFFNCLILETTGSPVLTNLRAQLWTSSAIAVNQSFMRIQIPQVASMTTLSQTELLTVRFRGSCFKGGVIPGNNFFTFAVIPGDVDAEGKAIVSFAATNSPPGTIPQATTDIGGIIGTIGSSGTGALGIASATVQLARFSALSTLAECKVTKPSLTVFEHPTRVTIPMPGSASDLDQYLGAVIMNSLLVVIGYLLYGLVVVVVFHRTKGIAPDWTTTKAAVGFPGRMSWLPLLLSGGTLKSTIVLLFDDQSSIGSQIVSILFLLPWVVSLCILAYFMLSGRFRFRYITEAEIGRQQRQLKEASQIGGNMAWSPDTRVRGQPSERGSSRQSTSGFSIQMFPDSEPTYVHSGAGELDEENCSAGKLLHPRGHWYPSDTEVVQQQAAVSDAAQATLPTIDIRPEARAQPPSVLFKKGYGVFFTRYRTARWKNFFFFFELFISSFCAIIDGVAIATQKCTSLALVLLVILLLNLMMLAAARPHRIIAENIFAIFLASLAVLSASFAVAANYTSSATAKIRLSAGSVVILFIVECLMALWMLALSFYAAWNYWKYRSAGGKVRSNMSFEFSEEIESRGKGKLWRKGLDAASSSNHSTTNDGGSLHLDPQVLGLPGADRQTIPLDLRTRTSNVTGNTAETIELDEPVQFVIPQRRDFPMSAAMMLQEEIDREVEREQRMMMGGGMRQAIDNYNHADERGYGPLRLSRVPDDVDGPVPLDWDAETYLPVRDEFSAFEHPRVGATAPPGSGFQLSLRREDDSTSMFGMSPNVYEQPAFESREPTLRMLQSTGYSRQPREFSADPPVLPLRDLGAIVRSRDNATSHTAAFNLPTPMSYGDDRSAMALPNTRGDGGEPSLSPQMNPAAHRYMNRSSVLERWGSAGRSSAPSMRDGDFSQHTAVPASSVLQPSFDDDFSPAPRFEPAQTIDRQYRSQPSIGPYSTSYPAAHSARPAFADLDDML